MAPSSTFHFPQTGDSDASSCFFKQLHHRHLTVRLCFKTTAESSCSALRSKDRQRAAGTFAAGWRGFFLPLFTKSRVELSTERIAAVTAAARAGDSHFTRLFAFMRVSLATNVICLQRPAQTCRSSVAKVKVALRVRRFRGLGTSFRSSRR